MYYVDKQIEVRYSETDQMGVVYHANYLSWLELGRTEFARSLDYDYLEMEKKGILSPVSRININYKKPVLFGGDATVRTWLIKMTPFRAIYSSIIYNENQDICVEADCEVTCVSKENFQMTSFQKVFPDFYQTYRDIVYKAEK